MWVALRGGSGSRGCARGGCGEGSGASGRRRSAPAPTAAAPAARAPCPCACCRGARQCIVRCADEHGSHGHDGGAQNRRASKVWRLASQHSRHACSATDRWQSLRKTQTSRCLAFVRIHVQSQGKAIPRQHGGELQRVRRENAAHRWVRHPHDGDARHVDAQPWKIAHVERLLGVLVSAQWRYGFLVKCFCCPAAGADSVSVAYVEAVLVTRFPV